MEQVLDRGGRVLTVREARALDLDAVEDLLHRLSPQSARQRFLSSSTSAGPQYVQALLDPRRTLDAVVVEAGPRIVGCGSTHPLPDGAVEFAVVVDDDEQGRGIGTVLMEALVSRARRRGAVTMVGTLLGANAQMFDILGHLGLSCHWVVEDGTADVTLTLGEDPAYGSAHVARTETARTAAMRPFMRPAKVAVLNPPGHARTRPLALAGRPAVPVAAIERVGGGFEVPAGAELALVPDWLGDAGPAALACAAAGVRAIALVGSRRRGHMPRSARPVLDPDVLDRILGAGARILGPGSEALVNTDPLVRIEVTEGRSRVAGGSVALVTDDATCLDHLRAELASRGVGVSAIVDVGVAADIEVQDVVAWLARDPRTEVILVSLADKAADDLVRELAVVHRTVKPVALLSGDGADVEGLVSSRTGTGPVLARCLGDLADLAMLLASQGLPPGRRVAVLTHQPWRVEGAADRELALRAMLGPDLTQHTEMRIHLLSPGTRSRGAVLALPPDATAEQVHDVLETLVDDPGVDAVVVDRPPSAGLRQHALQHALERGLRGVPRGRRSPVVVAVNPGGSRLLGTVPLFPSVHTALDTLALVCPLGAPPVGPLQG